MATTLEQIEQSTATTLLSTEFNSLANGSATTALTVNGSNVSGFPSSITTTNSNYTISQALAVGDVVKFVISAISSPTMLEFTLIGTNS